MRIALIDGSNFFEAAKAAQISIDYAMLKDFLEEDGNLLRMYYFTALLDKTVESPVRRTVDWLAHNGYTTITKEAKEYPVVENYLDQDKVLRSRTVTKLKGNVDIEIASYAFMLAARQKITEIWLFSGDGDFTIMVKELQEQYALKVYVVSTIGIVSTDLRKQCDKFIDIQGIADDIGKPYTRL